MMTRDARMAGIAASLLGVAALFPTNQRLWLRLHGNPSGSFVEEDAASVTALTPQPGGYKLWINGRHNSWLPFGGLHTMIGALPAVAHANPERVAVIGLGSGDTAWGAGCRKETRELVVFEIASSQRRLLAHVADDPLMGSLQRFLTDPRLRIVPDDGRRRLRMEGGHYDIIVADTVWPDVSMSGYLWSYEYYELLRERLKPNGLVCALLRTPRARNAARKAFPYRVRFGDDLLLLSPDPITIDKEAWRTRATSSFVVDYLRFRTKQLGEFIGWASYDTSPVTADLNRDLDPRDEFQRP
jgi:hypothetical protein